MKKSLVFGTATAILLTASLPSVACATTTGDEDTPAVTQVTGDDATDRPRDLGRLATVYGPSPIVREISEHYAEATKDGEEGDGKGEQTAELPDGATIAVAFVTLGIVTGSVVLARRNKGTRPVADTMAMPKVEVTDGKPDDADEPDAGGTTGDSEE